MADIAVGAPNPNMLPQAAAGGGALGLALARQRAAILNAGAPSPTAAPVSQYGPMPVNTGAPPTSVPNYPETFTPAQLAAYHAAHGIPQGPGGGLAGFLSTIGSLFGGAR